MIHEENVDDLKDSNLGLKKAQRPRDNRRPGENMDDLLMDKEAASFRRDATYWRERDWHGRDSQIHCDYICYPSVRRCKYYM